MDAFHTLNEYYIRMYVYIYIIYTGSVTENGGKLHDLTVKLKRHSFRDNANVSRSLVLDNIKSDFHAFPSLIPLYISERVCVCFLSCNTALHN